VRNPSERPRTIGIELGRDLELPSRAPTGYAARNPFVGRDVPRHDWQRQVWTAVRAAGVGAVLVDLGLPRPDELGDGPYVLVTADRRTLSKRPVQIGTLCQSFLRNAHAMAQISDGCSETCYDFGF